MMLILDVWDAHPWASMVGFTLLWLLFLLSLVCIFAVVPEHELRREEGSDELSRQRAQ